MLKPENLWGAGETMVTMDTAAAALGHRRNTFAQKLGIKYPAMREILIGGKNRSYL